MQDNRRLILIAAGVVLVGGIATAALVRDPAGSPVIEGVQADVLAVAPVREARTYQATVVDAVAITEMVKGQTSEEVCEDVVIQERLPERDGNVGGTVAGAVIGGLVGNQVGGGSGRKVATVAGAVAGGVIGNKVDQRHVGGQVVNRTERQCSTRQVPTSQEQVVGWQVSYRDEDGRIASQRMDSKPGASIEVEAEGEVIGYDVTYRLEGREQVIRLDERPQGDRITVPASVTPAQAP